MRSILKELPIDHSEFTFIDYGSGKGRVLLLAAEYPFKRIIGVELSKKLHEIAQNNIKIWKCSNPKCTDIKLCHGDATQFKLPDDPLVIFFFAPFRGIVKDLVVSNIRESFNANPRPIHIVYYGIRTDFIEISSDMNINHQEIYSRHPLPASGDYKGHLFSFSTESPT
ncbi:MAG: class I SAM-dependent methyltransferase [Deltaproteobacteria bacterium]|nr:class I SAM-dependent methyltransferase [Deltaproteobacteria bacterium]